MKKVLIVNLDQEEKVVYSAMVGASLFHVNPQTKISILCSSGADVMRSIGIFENVFDVSSTETNEKFLNKKHPEILKENWDFVINHSSELSAAAIASILDSEEFFGPSLKDQKIGPGLNHLSFSSYMLTELNGRPAPCHISQLYFDIVNLHYSDKKLPSIWTDSQLTEMRAKFDELKANFLKKRIILVDAGIAKINNLSDLNFLIQLTKVLDESTHYHPVLLSKSVDGDSFIINKIKEAVSEELTIASVSEEGLLSLLASVEMIVTDDSKLKSYSDLSQTPSLFLNRKAHFPLMDFSINPKSVLYACSEFKSNSPETVHLICKFISGDISESQLADVNELYKTVWNGNKVSLSPLSENVGSDYFKWILCNRFFSHLEKQNLPEFHVHESSYNSLVASQIEAIRSIFNVLLEKAKTEDSIEALDILKKSRLGNSSDIFLLALDYLYYQQAQSQNSLKKFLTKSKPVIQDLMNFLNSEEAKFSQKSISMSE